MPLSKGYPINITNKHIICGLRNNWQTKCFSDVCRSIVDTLMLSRPKLVKENHQPNPDEQSTKNTASSNGSNSRFIMSLNSRVGKLDRRLENVETHLQHLLHNRIGYKELGLTLILAVLIFTSAVLAIREIFPSSAQGNLDSQLMKHLNEQEDSKQKQSLLNVLSTMDSSPEIQAWAAMQLNGKGSLNQNQYHWPLEKSQDLDRIQYSQYKHGIHISANLGDPVVAMDDGKVIYSGNAIKAYGNLILLQHENNVISVYGNNYSNYVEEDQKIKKGDLIAAVGESTSQKARLYFEVRFKGKAQDPFLYFQ